MNKAEKWFETKRYKTVCELVLLKTMVAGKPVLLQSKLEQIFSVLTKTQVKRKL